MRDPERIDKFCNELEGIWKNNVPDWRFGQLISNFYFYLKFEGIDIFYLEENQFIEYFNMFLSGKRINVKS